MTLVVTAAYNDMLTDTAYVVSGGEVLPLFKGNTWRATWRTKLLVDDFQPSYGWMRVNLKPTDEGTPHDVVVRLYGDGQLFFTTTFTDKEPKRVPVGRFREWEIQVEAHSEVTSVDLATDIIELQD